MKIEDLKDGQAYRLTRDVTNPKPDRREKYAWTKFVTWEKGTVLYFRHDGDVYFREFRAQGYAGSMTRATTREQAERAYDKVQAEFGHGVFGSAWHSQAMDHAIALTNVDKKSQS